MKIIAFTDMHSSMKRLEHLEKLIKQAKPEMLLCPGDLTYFGRKLNFIAKKLDSFGIPILIVPGNHESNKDINLLAQRYKNFRNINIKIYMIKDYAFFGYGSGGFATVDKAFENAFKKIKEMLPRKKRFIIISHGPPYNMNQDFVKGKHVGSRTLRKFIEFAKPSLVLVGHIHECEHSEDRIGSSRIINPGDGEIITI